MIASKPWKRSIRSWGSSLRHASSSMLHPSPAISTVVMSVAAYISRDLSRKSKAIRESQDNRDGRWSIKLANRSAGKLSIALWILKTHYRKFSFNAASCLVSITLRILRLAHSVSKLWRRPLLLKEQSLSPSDPLLRHRQYELNSSKCDCNASIQLQDTQRLIGIKH